jgi:hypothetical protein
MEAVILHNVQISVVVFVEPPLLVHAQPATATPVRPAKYAETAYRHFFTLSPGEPYIVKPPRNQVSYSPPLTIPYLEKSDSKWVTVNPL